MLGTRGLPPPAQRGDSAMCCGFWGWRAEAVYQTPQTATVATQKFGNCVMCDFVPKSVDAQGIHFFYKLIEFTNSTKSVPMKFANEKLNRFVLSAGVLTTAALLTACGGGDKPCSTDQTLTITGTAYPKSTIQAQLGVPMTPITPVLAGIPASCQGEKRFELFSLNSHFSALPEGITLDARTGTISGTPTSLSPTKTVGGGPFPISTLSGFILLLPGYSAIQLGSITITVTK